MFTKEQKIRLKALLSKETKDLTADEAKELSTLSAAAKAANWDPATDPVEAASEGSLTEDEVKGVVVNALKTIGLDEETVKAIKDSLNPEGGKLTLDTVTKAIEKHLGGNGIDQKALIEEIKKSIPASKGVTADELETKLKEFAKGFTSRSRHEFPEGGEADLPIVHRTGNLSVAQKQLLNICLMNVTDAAIREGKSVRPTGENDGITEAVLAKAVSNGEFRAKSLRHEIVYNRKAITSTGVGSGDELVNTDLSSDLLMRLYLESTLAAEMVSMEIQMPTNPFKLPMTTTRPTFKVGGEAGGTPTESSPGTAAPLLDAAKLIGMSSYSYEAEEDAIIAILPMLQEQLGSAAADALEDALINGDTTGTHMDSDTNGVTAHAAKLFKGFRKYALAGSLGTSLATGGISADNIGAMRKAMGKYGIRPRDLLLLAGVKGYNDIVQLEETLTAEKVGSNMARIITGDAPSLYGIRVLVSSQIREDLNASGVYDGATTTKGSILLIHKPSFLLGVRRGFTIEVETEKKEQLNYVIASFRRAFVPKETPSATVQSVALGYNYTA